MIRGVIDRQEDRESEARRRWRIQIQEATILGGEDDYGDW